jgi:TonB family protein
VSVFSFKSHTGRALAVIIVLALVIVIATVHPTAVDVFFHRVTVAPDTAQVFGPGAAETIIAIGIDPETNATGVIDVTPPPPPPPVARDTTRAREEEKQPDRRGDLDLDDVLEGEAAPRGGASSGKVASVPPRPVEITWPETRELKLCIGQSVNVRIWVSEAGQAKQVEAVPSAVLPACVDAALGAARRIRFEPGRQGGVPAAMWTEVRIDFQRRD